MREAVASVVARTSVAVPRAPQLPFWEPSTTGARGTGFMIKHGFMIQKLTHDIVIRKTIATKVIAYDMKHIFETRIIS